MMRNKDNIIKRIGELSALLNGTVQQTTVVNSMGRKSKKIIIEYDVEILKDIWQGNRPLVC